MRQSNNVPLGNSPQGHSPYGVAYMADNVWEWVSTLYKPYPYEAHDGRKGPEAAVKDERVYDRNGHGRCSTRAN